MTLTFRVVIAITFYSLSKALFYIREGVLLTTVICSLHIMNCRELLREVLVTSCYEILGFIECAFEVDTCIFLFFAHLCKCAGRAISLPPGLALAVLVAAALALAKC